jgi:hypothetical protein
MRGRFDGVQMGISLRKRWQGAKTGEGEETMMMGADDAVNE